MVYPGIGGQAVMEGIMMKNNERYALAVRKADGEIEVFEDAYEGFSGRHKWAKWPFVRGVFSFIDSLVLGIRTLMKSANMGGEEEEQLSEKETALTVVIALLFAVGIFMVLPTVLANLLKKVIESAVLLAVLEGLLRLLLFVGYIALISRMKDIKRTFMYHGSEHKCINCIEHGLPLTVENVLKSSKEHKRCGTSFLLIVMLISIVLFVFVRADGLILRILSRILLIPVVAGVSYEILRLLGRYDNALVNILVKPGLWLQGLTTREPDAEMAEVAIKAVEAVFDWRGFEEETFGPGEVKE